MRRCPPAAFEYQFEARIAEIKKMMKKTQQQRENKKSKNTPGQFRPVTNRSARRSRGRTGSTRNETRGKGEEWAACEQHPMGVAGTHKARPARRSFNACRRSHLDSVGNETATEADHLRRAPLSLDPRHSPQEPQTGQQATCRSVIVAFDFQSCQLREALRRSRLSHEADFLFVELV